MEEVLNLSGLIAYPSSPPIVGETIKRATELLENYAPTQQLLPWEENDIPGRFIDSEVMNKIHIGNLLIADISVLNFNVVFEIGYAIGCKNRIFLIKNSSIGKDDNLRREVGVFDTIGYKEYSDGESLRNIIKAISDVNPIKFDETKANNSSPVYLILPNKRTEIDTHLISRIKKAKLFYRSYDPMEVGSMAPIEVIQDVASSHGIVLTLLGNEHSNFVSHNMRSAFVAGLAMGMQDKEVLILQQGNDPVPIDYSNFVRRFYNIKEIDEIINEFAPNITEKIQSKRAPIVENSTNLLENITIGASSAENEYRDLSDYYLTTDEYKKVERGEVQIVLGRKGSGKSALFFQLRDRLRRDKRNLVIDLKPEGFQLLKLKEQVLDFLEEGTRDHTITAFWEYILLLEICHKILQDDKSIYMRNHNLFDPYRALERAYNSDKSIPEGDFPERLFHITRRLSSDFSNIKKDGSLKVRLQSGEITDFLYRHDVSNLRASLINYLTNKDSVWILIDNLDKGWPPHGVSQEDVRTLRSLLDAMRKIQRELRYGEVITNGIVFIRNDVFENLVYSTPDRGKISRVLIDWVDSRLLLEMLRRRFLSNDLFQGNPSFEEIWQQICVSHVDGQESSDYFTDRCLMRPRSLIEFFKLCQSQAVNLGHTKIQVEDIKEAEGAYSIQMVNDIGFEIQDVLPEVSDVLYEFIECNSKLNELEMKEIIDKISKTPEVQEKVFELLLWYGVIGFHDKQGEATFIYSVRYDMKKLTAILNNRKKEGVTYIINPAFWAGLEVGPN